MGECLLVEARFLLFQILFLMCVSVCNVTHSQMYPIGNGVFVLHYMINPDVGYKLLISLLVITI